MKNLLITLLFCTSFAVQAGTLSATNRDNYNLHLPIAPPNNVCAEAIPVNPPVARCLESVVTNLDADGNDGSTDLETPADELVFGFDPAEGLVDCDDVGTQSVSLIVTDNVGKTDTCFTQVTVEDYAQDVELFFGQHSNSANLSVIVLDEPFPVIAGQEYSFFFFGDLNLSLSCGDVDAYPRGRSFNGIVERDNSRSDLRGQHHRANYPGF
jgi:hypothetical protein